MFEAASKGSELVDLLDHVKISFVKAYAKDNTYMRVGRYIRMLQSVKILRKQ